jgi:adenylate cyclase
VSARKDQPPEGAIRQQLERILESAQFAAAESARKVLRFLVEEALAGRSHRLKEYTLATDVFGRDASFDPKTNPVVRVEASRLRRRLEFYYLTLGREDPVLIELPRGTYVPAFHPHADVLHLGEALAHVKADRTGNGAAAALAKALPVGPSILVLPFETLGGADSVFGDGITVEMVTALSRFREFHVIGRGTAFAHRGEKDAMKLHDELGADYTLTGSVRREDDRVRVHAELLCGADGKVCWAEGYERDLSTTAIFEVQEDIASRVVAAIAQPRGAIARPELAAARRKPPGKLGSYDCLLLFYDYAANRSPDGHRKVRAALEAQLVEDPGAAALWAALSFAHTDTWRFGYNVTDTRALARERGVEAARRAVKLDPLNSLCYHALFLACFALGDLKGFREAGNRCLELNPNHTDALADYGLHLTLCDEWEVGLVLLKVALAQSPQPADWFWFPFFIWHYDRGEFDAALDMALRCRSEGLFWTHGMHALAYAALGMHTESAAAVGRLLETYPEFPRRAREELAHWLSPARRERMLQALRAAGVPIPEDESGPAPESARRGTPVKSSR